MQPNPTPGLGRRRVCALALLPILALLPACRDTEALEGSASLTVLAASSLTDAFADLAGRFEAEHPGVRVRVSTAGSQALRLQVEQGARADLYVSANRRHAVALFVAGHLVDTMRIASNALTIVVPRDNPAGIHAVEDLSDAQRIVVGAEGVPAGDYTRRLLNRLGLWEVVAPKVASQEANVRLVLTKVELGEADAALVYASDVVAGRDVREVPIPPDLNEVVTYYGGVVRDAPEPAWAAEFLSFVTSAEGVSAMAEHGIRAPR